MAESSTPIRTITDTSTIVTDPLRIFRFKATFTPLTAGGDAVPDTFASFSGGFTGVSGLRTDVAVMEYREGGYNTTMHKVPGMTSFGPGVFSRGALYGSDAAINWMRTIFAVSSGEGLAVSTGQTFRCNIKVELMDHPTAGANSNVPRMAFYLSNCWISNLGYSDLNAAGNELMFESITVQHEGLTVAFTNDKGTPNPTGSGKTFSAPF
jgi:phage tail-like protein